MDNFVYLIGDEETKECAVIDCGFEAEKIKKIAEEQGYKITHILLTHVHYDHAGAAEELQSLIRNGYKPFPTKKEENVGFGLKPNLFPSIYAHYKSREKQSLNSEQGYWIIPEHYEPLKEGSVIKIGNQKIKVFETPGHQNDHLVFQAGKYLFTGDTLFIGRCGRVDLPDSDSKAMEQTLKRISTWDDDLIVCPGHDYGEVIMRSLKEEKKKNICLHF